MARDILTPHSIEELRTEIRKWLSIPDEDSDLIDFCLAVYVSQRIPGDPLWGMIVDASGGGKTELLRAFRDFPESYFLSKLTEKTLISGYRDPKEPGRDPSLLKELDGKVLIVKDLAPILQMRSDSREKILADLRDAYDGFSDNGSGMTGKVSYQARFSFLAACTLAIERFSSVEQELGERTVKFRAHGESSHDKTRRAIQGIGRDDTMRTELQHLIHGFLNQVMPFCTRVPERLFEPLAILADFTARARSSVPRDRNGDLQYIPKPEVGTRLGKELGKLLISLAAIRGKSEPDDRDFATVKRVAEDSIPPNRLGVIRALTPAPMQLCEVKKATGLPHKTAQRVLDDLRVLGIVVGEGDPENLVWRLITL
jgi:hypothetical protein